MNKLKTKQFRFSIFRFIYSLNDTQFFFFLLYLPYRKIIRINLWNCEKIRDSIYKFSRINQGYLLCDEKPILLP